MTNTVWTPVAVIATNYQGRNVVSTAILDDSAYTMDSQQLQINGLELQSIYAQPTAFNTITKTTTIWTQA